MLQSFFLTITLLLSNIIGTSVQDSTAIKKLEQRTDFKIYVPTVFESATNYEIKVPDSIAAKANYILINYFDDNDAYLFGVRQLKNNSIVEKEIVNLDINKGTQHSKKITQKIELKPQGEQVFLNGQKGWYIPYVGKQPTGGVLKWIEGNTYMELDTSKLPKASLIKIAESMVAVE
ncbi:MAG: DUF4367 domain-containing protein [Paenibacillus macerans]|uniref:DUF4367 domain-containing protein n=2 Tax=Paenibacillus macerans TaxID=44252 RepID=A0A090ZNY0_PAEMA|nr:DUF4367 domain-containing protein [Paenibacillus macerans]KFN12108.1 hypothetical protein DJ90_2001 [Paenibacillus macerans]MCY7558503.1 DUF4367 domain-containing protein [Paenibacillus macerans]MDU7472196.1 DUF4367 domain-containing protein [Paenibacillus macerans]MEC0150269.1 DUF4367 domain-containing protein [Paenibacillus macerans]SUA84386.1 Uncharacterised protein [Paenibacillus macerans]